MDVSQQVAIFKELFDTWYKEELLECFRKGQHFIIVDYDKVSRFDAELAENIIDYPEQTIGSAELAVREFEIPKGLKKFRVRFANLPNSMKLQIRDIRSEHIGKLYVFEGIVRQKSEVRPQAVNAKFECPSCGNIISILQQDKNFQEPTRCACGRKGKFTLLSKDLIDAQAITLEEMTEQLKNGAQPKRIAVIQKEDLVRPMADIKTNPGSKVLVVGIIKEIQKLTRANQKSTMFDIIIEANYVKPLEDSYDDIELCDEDILEIKKLSQDENVFKTLVRAIIPSMKGETIIKEAILLQLMGGVKKIRPDGIILRGDIHIFLVGDPGKGKSQTLKRISNVAPRSRYVSGKGSSAAGLTASVVKDEFVGGWGLEAGALVLANKGFIMIDELDKMGPEDRSAMHEALEQQSVSISKANIQATLRCETSVLAAANPKFGKFDNYEKLSAQIDIPITLLNRFDLIFPLRDIPDSKKDEELAEFIFNMHAYAEITESEISTELIRKYIVYARQHCIPKMSLDARKLLVEYYVNLRNANSDQKHNKAIPINARQLEGLIRLSEASAKTRLSNEVTIADAKKAIELTSYCMSQVAVDPKTGQIDSNLLSSGISESERSNIGKVVTVIRNLLPNIRDIIDTQEVVAEAVSRGVPEEEVDGLLKKLNKTGDIFFPKPGKIARHGTIR